MKRILFVVLCMVFLFEVATVASAASFEKVVKIGLVGSWTGPLGAMGNMFKYGALVAQKQINEEGKFVVAGQKYKIEFVEWDDRTDPKMAVAGVTKLMDQEGIKIFQGPMLSASVLAVQPITEAKKVIVACASMADQIIRPGVRYTARTIPAATWAGNIMVHFLVNSMEIKTVALITENTATALSQEKAARSVFESLGTKIVGREVYEVGTTDFFTPLTKLKVANPDVLFIPGSNPEPVALIIKQTKETGWPVQTVSMGGVATGAFFEVAGKTCEGHIEKSALNMLDPGPALVKITGIDLNLRKKFAEGMKKMFPKEDPLNFQAQLYYDMTYLLVEAMKVAGTVEDTDRIIKAVLNSKFKGVGQQFNFMPNGQNKFLGTLIVRIHPGGSFDFLGYALPTDETNKKWEVTLISKVKTIKAIRAERGY